MTDTELRPWRKELREELVAKRVAVSAETLAVWRRAIDDRLERAFPQLAQGTIALCWPYRNEYDARFLAQRLRERGARTALPVVVAPRQPLVFREWHPGVKMAHGVYDIPYPADTPEVVPTAVLVPMNGFDGAGYRLGYGGGFFDRTLEKLGAEGRRPLVIGVTFELARIDTIRPQPYDIPMDYVVTERAAYRRGERGLELYVPA